MTSRVRRRWELVRADGGDEGMTMVEVMVALIVLGLFASAAVVALTRGLDLTRTNHDRGLAAALASAEIDKVRDQVALDSTALAIGQTVTTTVVDKVTFTVRREVEWVNQDSTAGSCDGGTGSTRSARAYLNVDASVTWRKMSGAKPVHADTIVYPKVGAFDPVTGAAAVKVLSAAGKPQSGATVSLAGPDNRTQQTSSDGCVFSAYIKAGVYTATVSTPGFVDPNGNASATNSSVGITVGSITNVQLDYDQASGLDVTPTPRDAAHPAAAGLPVRLANTRLTAGVTSAFCGGSAYPCAVRGLFPFASGDTLWAGDCADARPGAGLTAGLTPGSTTPSGTTPLADLDVTVSGTLPKQVWISHVAEGSSSGCTTLRRYLVGTSPGGSANVLQVGIPFGTWTVATSSTTAPQSSAPTTRPGAYDLVSLSESSPTAVAQVS